MWAKVFSVTRKLGEDFTRCSQTMARRCRIGVQDKGMSQRDDTAEGSKAWGFDATIRKRHD